MLQIITNPLRADWSELIRRPALSKNARTRVSEILENVKSRGVEALRYYSRKYDNVDLKDFSLKTSTDGAQLNAGLRTAIEIARSNIERFHAAQRGSESVIETMPGVKCWRRTTAIERVGLYIPGGSAPLFSTLLMLAVPATLAGCREIIVCTPPRPDGSVDPAILYTAGRLGIKQIFTVGGAQAIGAMAYGAGEITAVDKIFGPGNQYVTLAKLLVQLEGLAIDMPAGPSEVLIIADAGAKPEFVAADLLSQAEHGPDSQVLLLSDSRSVLQEVNSALVRQLKDLPRRDIASQALLNSRAVAFESLSTAMEFSNLYAPEHLILNCADAESWVYNVKNAGSVFVGPYSCESAGDYASGTNHSLPTNGAARACAGVSLESFVKNITFQQLSGQGLLAISPAVATMARAEQLEGHARAVDVRLSDLRAECAGPEAKYV